MKLMVTLMLFIFVVTGCASTGKMDPNYIAYLDAHKSQVSTQKQEIQLFKLVAREGETIELKGVKEFSVSMPAPATDAPKPYEPKPNEWVGLLNTMVKVGGAVAGYYVVGDAVEGIVNSVGKHSGGNITNSYNDSSSGSFREISGGSGMGNTDAYNDKSTGDFRNNTGDNYGNTDNSDGNFRNFTGDNAGTSDRHDIVDNTDNSVANSTP